MPFSFIPFIYFSYEREKGKIMLFFASVIFFFLHSEICFTQLSSVCVWHSFSHRALLTFSRVREIYFSVDKKKEKKISRSNFFREIDRKLAKVGIRVWNKKKWAKKKSKKKRGREKERAHLPLSAAENQIQHIEREKERERENHHKKKLGTKILNWAIMALH